MDIDFDIFRAFIGSKISMDIFFLKKLGIEYPWIFRALLYMYIFVNLMD